MGFLTSSLVFCGFVSVLYAQQLPIHCAAMLCAQPNCLKPAPPPPGQCCPICPGRPNCALVDCPQLRCVNQYTPPGRCCPICKPPVLEKPGRCPSLRGGIDMIGTCVERCTNDYSCPGRQKCCSNGCGHICRNPSGSGWPNCALVDCPQLRCVNQYTPPGRCCPVCRPPDKVDCSAIQCLQVFCIGQYTPRGQCCPICPPTGY